jgi:hypothetical protein
MNWKSFLPKRFSKKQDQYPLATSHEQIAGNICAQLGHLSEGAIVEIVKSVVKKKLPKFTLGYKPYGLNPKKVYPVNADGTVTVTMDTDGQVVNE